MEDNTSADAPAQATPAQSPAPKKAKKAHRKAKRQAAKAPLPPPKAPKASSASAGTPQGVLIAVYAILGILILGTSFWIGYDLGKSAGLKQAGIAPTGGENLGGAEGTIQIIEYSDYQCPFCSRAEPTVKQIKQAYGDKVEIIYKHYPLESIHPDAFGASVAAECVRKYDEGKFQQYHDLLFANQNALDTASLKKYATQVGANSKVATCIDSKETESIVRQHMSEAESRGVQGTPSFWIKDELLVGAQPFESFKQKIDDKLAGKAPTPPPQPSAPEAPSAPVDVAEGRYAKGPADAPVVIVEFTDYQCPFCKRFFTQTEAQIMNEYVKTGKVRMSVRHFPLGFHAQAQKAAEAAECAGKQGKFWEMHETLFNKGEGDGTGLDVASLKTYAKDLGLDTAKFNTCMDNGETADIVKKDFSEGQAAGVSGTPSFYVNGKQLVGAQPFSSFKAAIDAELAE